MADDEAQMGAAVNVLIDNLIRAGKAPLPVSFPDGSRLLALPGSGRVLGLFPAGDEANFLWTHPDLAESATAAGVFAPGGWSNPGGDRTWLAPELDLFVSDLARKEETYAVPAALDPGHWRLAAAAAAEVSMANATRLRLHRPEREVGARLSKTYSPTANPLLGTPAEQSGLRYAGYTLVTTLELEPLPDAPFQLGIWNLLQLPQPGQMLIPTRAPTQPRLFFGACSPGDLTVEPRLVRWNMAGSGGANVKIGIKAQPLAGRAGYLRQTAVAGIWDLVVREFAVDPAGDYVDALWDNPRERGWVFQACCVSAGRERFNELEYHAPAAATTPGRNVSRDESRVWAFRGSGSAVAEAARVLLESNFR
jgi:hypothetical protein